MEEGVKPDITGHEHTLCNLQDQPIINHHLLQEKKQVYSCPQYADQLRSPSWSHTMEAKPIQQNPIISYM